MPDMIGSLDHHDETLGPSTGSGSAQYSAVYASRITQLDGLWAACREASRSPVGPQPAQWLCDLKPGQIVALRTETAVKARITTRIVDMTRHQVDLIGTYSNHRTRADLLKCTRRWLAEGQ